MKEIQISKVNEILYRYRNDTLTYDTIRKILQDLEE